MPDDGWRPTGDALVRGEDRRALAAGSVLVLAIAGPC
jgi:hypothetical protein